MKVLGVHIGHDSAASLVIDGRIVADVSEERLLRVKHSFAMPIHSIENCLRMGETDIDGIDIVALTSKHARGEANFLFGLTGRRYKGSTTSMRIINFLFSRAWGAQQPFPLYLKRFPVSPATQLVQVEHHLAHAASAYYTSGKSEKQLVVTMDGEGDESSVAIWRGDAGRIACLKRFPESASLGFFYSNVTEALGWWHGDGEGKTMGLAAYGEPSKSTRVLEPFCPKFSAGELVEPHDFGNASAYNESGAYHFHFEEARKIENLLGTHRREDIAAAAQAILEEQTAALIFPWLERENTRCLSCAGGVFLNVRLNQRIRESGRVDFHHIFPNAGDAGLAAGAALYAYYSENPGAPMYPLDHMYWGPEYSNEEISYILQSRGLAPRFEEDIARVVARLLAENKMVGWFQGRMESGPRALGGRSILMSPLLAENKDVLNSQVKFRDSFRPFGPSIAARAADTYVQRSRIERFMVTSFDATTGKRNAIRAVVHVDGTVRPQMVEAHVNPLYHRLIEEFAVLTGEHVLLNTSFNLQGEPIVCHPRDAIRCFFDSGLDYLVMGNYILEKPRERNTLLQPRFR